MIYTPMIFLSSNAGLSDNFVRAFLIVANAMLLISLAIFYYLFSIENYTGSFWNWSWFVYLMVIMIFLRNCLAT